MSEFKPNSHRSKSENKKVEKVVSGKARLKKRSGLDKVKDNFISEDVKNVKSYVIGDVLIPAAKKAISDIVSNGIDMILYGETRSKKSPTGATYVSYDRFSDRRDSRGERYSSSRSPVYSCGEIIVDSRGEAEEVLRQLDALIETYDCASVSDLYEMVGLTGSFTDNRYGWDSIRNVTIYRTRDGSYAIKMPKPIVLD